MKDAEGKFGFRIVVRNAIVEYAGIVKPMGKASRFALTVVMNRR